VREIRRGQLTQEEGEVPGKAGPVGTYRGYGATTGRRGQLGTATFQCRVAPAVVGGLKGGEWYCDQGWRRGGVWLLTARSEQETNGARGKNLAGNGGGALLKGHDREAIEGGGGPAAGAPHGAGWRGV
jgi:hypothetical protein